MIRISLVLTFATVLVGCSSTAKLSRIDGASQPEQLSRQSAVYVGMPQNGSFEGAEYKTSGGHTANAIAMAFRLFANRVVSANVCEQHTPALLSAKAKNCAYYAEPTILYWEDRNTEWSGRPDVICVRVALFDVASGRVIDDVQLNAKSKWATFGGDHPQDLLARPITEYVAALYGEKPPVPASSETGPAD